MPETFPVLDKATGRLVPTEFHSLAEVAEMLHISVSTAKKWRKKWDWPCITVVNRFWFSAADIGVIMAGFYEGATVGRDCALGIPVPPDPWLEPGPADQDPGGVR